MEENNSSDRADPQNSENGSSTPVAPDKDSGQAKEKMATDTLNILSALSDILKIISK